MKNVKLVYPVYLYLSDDLLDIPLKKIKFKIRYFPKSAPYFLILKSASEKNQFDIMKVSELLKISKVVDSSVVVGIAGDYDRAMDLLTTIAEAAVAAGFGGNLRDYVESLNGLEIAIRNERV